MYLYHKKRKMVFYDYIPFRCKEEKQGSLSGVEDQNFAIL